MPAPPCAQMHRVAAQAAEHAVHWQTRGALARVCSAGFGQGYSGGRQVGVYSVQTQTESRAGRVLAWTGSEHALFSAVGQPRIAKFGFTRRKKRKTEATGVQRHNQTAELVMLRLRFFVRQPRVSCSLLDSCPVTLSESLAWFGVRRHAPAHTWRRASAAPLWPSREPACSSACTDGGGKHRQGHRAEGVWQRRLQAGRVQGGDGLVPQHVHVTAPARKSLGVR